MEIQYQPGRFRSLKFAWEEPPDYTDEELEYLQGFFTEEKNQYGTIRRYNKKGQYHNTRGPAIIYDDGTLAYYVNGEPHRTDGPAFIGANGSVVYWVNGRELSEEEFNRLYGQNRRGSLQIEAEEHGLLTFDELLQKAEIGQVYYAYSREHGVHSGFEFEVINMTNSRNSMFVRYIAPPLWAIIDEEWWLRGEEVIDKFYFKLKDGI